MAGGRGRKRKICCSCNCKFCGNEKDEDPVIKVFVCSAKKCYFQSQDMDDIYRHKAMKHDEEIPFKLTNMGEVKPKKRLKKTLGEAHVGHVEKTGQNNADSDLKKNVNEAPDETTEESAEQSGQNDADSGTFSRPVSNLSHVESDQEMELDDTETLDENVSDPDGDLAEECELDGEELDIDNDGGDMETELDELDTPEHKEVKAFKPKTEKASLQLLNALHKELGTTKFDLCTGMFYCKICDVKGRGVNFDIHGRLGKHMRLVDNLKTDPKLFCSMENCTFQHVDKAVFAKHHSESHSDYDYLAPSKAFASVNIHVITTRNGTLLRLKEFSVGFSYYEKLKMELGEKLKPNKPVLKPSKCEECGRVISADRSWLDHKIKFHSKNSCDQCDFKTNVRNLLFRHIRFHHRKVCEKCSLVIAESEERDGHQCPNELGPGPPDLSGVQNVKKESHNACKLPNGTFVCMDCGFTTKRAATIEHHDKMVHAHFKCHLCPYGSFSEHGLKSHITREHELRCKECHYHAKSDRDLDTHACNPREMFQDGKELTDGNICEICGFHGISRNSLSAHKKKIHPTQPELPFQCPHCLEKFAGEAERNTHVKNVHKKTFMYHCLHCDFESPRRSVVEIHNKRNHDSADKTD